MPEKPKGLSIPVFRGHGLLGIIERVGEIANKVTFNPRFQGTWIVRDLDSIVVWAKSVTFNPRFQGTWIVSRESG